MGTKMDAAEFEEHLDAALNTRPAIEQAKGILVRARAATPEQAFAEIKYVSHQHSVQVNALAAALVETAAGREPDDPLLRKVIWQEWDDLMPGSCG